MRAGRSNASRPVRGKRSSVSVTAKADNTRQAREREKLEKAKRRDSRRRKREERAIARARDKRSSATGDMPKLSSEDAAGEDAGDSGRGASRRVGDIRAAEREKRNRSRYRRYILRIAAGVAAVLVVVFGSIFVYRSDLFHVSNVHVNGVSHLTSQEITNIAAVPSDSTLLRLDSDAIVERLEQNAWVQSASVSRVLPDTIEIDVTERQPAAVVRLNNKATWVISSDGTWLSAATSDDWKKGPRIIDVSKSLSQPVSGSDCNDGGIKNALAIIAGISDDLKSQVKSISAESSIKTSLNLSDGVTVAFGDSSDIKMKEAAIDALLEQYSGKISYINVRVPSRPTYRTLSE